MNKLLNLAYGTLGHPIGCRVVRGSELDANSSLLTPKFQTLAGECGPIITDDYLCVGKYSPFQECDNTVAVLAPWARSNHASALVNGQEERLCLLDSFGFLFELGEVEMHYFEWAVRVLGQCHHIGSLVVLDFVLLTPVARSDVTGDIMLQSWPRESLRYFAIGSPDAIMSSRMRAIMVEIKDF